MWPYYVLKCIEYYILKGEIEMECLFRSLQQKKVNYNLNLVGFH